MVSSRFCRRSAMFFTVLMRLVSGSSPGDEHFNMIYWDVWTHTHTDTHAEGAATQNPHMKATCAIQQARRTSDMQHFIERLRRDTEWRQITGARLWKPLIESVRLRHTHSLFLVWEADTLFYAALTSSLQAHAGMPWHHTLPPPGRMQLRLFHVG